MVCRVRGVSSRPQMAGLTTTTVSPRSPAGKSLMSSSPVQRLVSWGGVNACFSVVMVGVVIHNQCVLNIGALLTVNQDGYIRANRFTDWSRYMRDWLSVGELYIYTKMFLGCAKNCWSVLTTYRSSVLCRVLQNSVQMAVLGSPSPTAFMVAIMDLKQH